mmetsp:Transcript_16282/g.49029  ORF Transcript_16282/g.49029 Transcript_16282/m.49029 type:complete len:216 (-) Transcript_16282:2013-2660(-)
MLAPSRRLSRPLETTDRTHRARRDCNTSDFARIDEIAIDGLAAGSTKVSGVNVASSYGRDAPRRVRRRDTTAPRPRRPSRLGPPAAPRSGVQRTRVRKPAAAPRAERHRRRGRRRDAGRPRGPAPQMQAVPDEAPTPRLWQRAQRPGGRLQPRHAVRPPGPRAHRERRGTGGRRAIEEHPRPGRAAAGLRAGPVPARLRASGLQGREARPRAAGV